MPTSHEEQLQLRIRELEKEVAHLHDQIKQQRYGLNWIDVPEAFDKESENKIPTLEEVPELSFKTDDGKPTHILIEGDNYHALTCLNYTHRGKVDVIYIDPPYNTGSDGFIYKDKRMLDRYPDGTPVPADSPLRHSYWLSFMKCRLSLAKELLKDNGILFISIDMNELAQLKQLCDSEQLFGQNAFIECFVWNKTSTPPALSYKSRKTHEYILCYQKRPDSSRFVGMRNQGGDAPLLNESNAEGVLSFPAKTVFTSLNDGVYEAGQRERVELLNDVIVKEGIIENAFSLRGKFRWSQATLDREIVDDCYLIVKSNKFAIRYCRQGERTVAPSNYIPTKIYERDTSINKEEQGVDTNDTAGKELSKIIGRGKFDFPKPTSLVAYLLSFIDRKNTIILDFFAGSGTTMHATMNLNEEDGGQRQCILVQLNEADICRNVTYERNRRVMQGYTDARGNKVAGLGNSLKYYRTAFVGENDAKHANEQDRLLLSQKAGCLLALAENTLDETLRTSHYQLFTDGKRLTAVYFQEDLQRFEEFVEQVRSKALPTSVYVFCWGSAEEFLYNFEDIPNVSLKSIPEPILKIYQTLNA